MGLFDLMLNEKSANKTAKCTSGTRSLKSSNAINSIVKNCPLNEIQLDVQMKRK